MIFEEDPASSSSLSLSPQSINFLLSTSLPLGWIIYMTQAQSVQ